MCHCSLYKHTHGFQVGSYRHDQLSRSGQTLYLRAVIIMVWHASEAFVLYINERREVSTLQLSIPASGHLADDLHLHLRSRSCPTARRQEQGRVRASHLRESMDTKTASRFLGLFFMSARIGTSLRGRFLRASSRTVLTQGSACLHMLHWHAWPWR